jgi:hypothetical protein
MIFNLAVFASIARWIAMNSSSSKPLATINPIVLPAKLFACMEISFVKKLIETIAVYRYKTVCYLTSVQRKYPHRIVKFMFEALDHRA